MRNTNHLYSLLQFSIQALGTALNLAFERHPMGLTACITKETEDPGQLSFVHARYMPSVFTMMHPRDCNLLNALHGAPPPPTHTHNHETPIQPRGRHLVASRTAFTASVSSAR